MRNAADLLMDSLTRAVKGDGNLKISPLSRAIGLERESFRLALAGTTRYPSPEAILPLARELQKAGYPIPGYYVSDEPVVSVPLFRAPLPVKKGKPSGICEASLFRATIRAAASLRPRP